MFCVGVALVAVSVWFYARPDEIVRGVMHAASRLSPGGRCNRLSESFSSSPSRAPPKALAMELPPELAPASSATSPRASKDGRG